MEDTCAKVAGRGEAFRHVRATWCAARLANGVYDLAPTWVLDRPTAAGLGGGNSGSSEVATL